MLFLSVTGRYFSCGGVFFLAGDQSTWNSCCIEVNVITDTHQGTSLRKHITSITVSEAAHRLLRSAVSRVVSSTKQVLAD